MHIQIYKRQRYITNPIDYACVYALIYPLINVFKFTYCLPIVCLGFITIPDTEVIHSDSNQSSLVQPKRNPL